MDKETVTREYNNYSDSYILLEGILINLLKNKEIKQDDIYDLEEAYSSYVNNAENIKIRLNTENDIIKANILEKSTAITKEKFLELMTEGGKRNLFYQGNNGEILINGQAVPSLVLLAKKLNLIATDGEDESTIILTPTFIELISNSDILLKASNIQLEGYTTINNGFSIDKEGNMSAKDGNFEGHIKAKSGEISSDMIVEELNVGGNISADSITVRNLNCQNIAGVLTSDVTVEVNSAIGNDASLFVNGSVFATLQCCIESIPKILNGNQVTINLNSMANENIVFKGFNGGTLVININKDIQGNIKGLDCSSKILLKGIGESSVSVLKYNYKLTGNLNMRTGRDASYDLITTITSGSYLLVIDIQNGWGYTTWNGSSGYISLNTSYTTEVEIYEDIVESNINIKPSTLIENDENKYSVYFENCNYVETSNVNIYGKTESNDYILGANRGSNIKIENVKTVGSQNGVYAYNMSKILENNTSGKVNGIAHKASLGSIISIENGTMMGGSIEKTDDSQIIYNISNVTSDESSEVGSNDNTTVASETIILKADGANTYRHNVYTGWKNDNTAKQGDYGYGDCDGYWFFGNQFEKLQGKNIKQITLKITRQNGGVYASHSHTLRAHTYTSKPYSGVPSFYESWTQTFYAAVGDTVTIIITDSTLLNAISSGIVKGFGVKDAYDKAHYSVLSGSIALTAIV